MDTLHHANIILSEKDPRDFVFDILEKKLNFKIHKNPDFSFFRTDSFGILDARNLEKWTMGKPLSGNTKVYLLMANSITSEAQNALLKVLEEPPRGTYIFIVIENLGNILPTFLSRIRVFDLRDSKGESNARKNDVARNAEMFLKSGIKSRLATIVSLAKDESKIEMKNLIRDLEEIAYHRGFDQKNMKNILTAKIFATSRGSSPKMLLEWLSCVI